MRLPWVLPVLALAACQSVERNAAAPESVAASRGFFAGASAAEEMMAYLGRLRAMSEGALAAETARQKQLAARNADDLTRLKAALALSLSPQGEDADILALVDPVAKRAGADSDVRAMASFLQVLASERRRLRDSATAARNNLREERRALEAQKQRADTLQERAAQLQQKLDALTELEKSLSDRPPPSR
jgi:hypothetical protein